VPERWRSLSEVAGHLRCPHCRGELALTGSALVCASGHSFDIARQGYVNLLPGDARAGTADTPEMVGARVAFLAAGHFSPLAERLAAECRRLSQDAPARAPVVDIGAGTGYYLARVLDSLNGRNGIALDISKHAARRAASAHPRLASLVCDAWGELPVRDGAAGIVLSVFAPRNAGETSRILGARGALILVIPTRDHLAEVVAPLGLLDIEERKEERLEAQLGAHFRLESRSAYSFALCLNHADLEGLVTMGPSARHTDPAATRERVAALPAETLATASVAVCVYRPR
jgi:23S rRNA (guanine745-N1)-methyltransferase